MRFAALPENTVPEICRSTGQLKAYRLPQAISLGIKRRDAGNPGQGGRTGITQTVQIALAGGVQVKANGNVGLHGAVTAVADLHIPAAVAAPGSHASTIPPAVKGQGTALGVVQNHVGRQHPAQADFTQHPAVAHVGSVRIAQFQLCHPHGGGIVHHIPLHLQRHAAIGIDCHNHAATPLFLLGVQLAGSGTQCPQHRAKHS